MNPLVFARWGATCADFRANTGLSQDGALEMFPFLRDLPANVVAVLSGKGFLVFEEGFNFVQLVREYVDQIQARYCCGKCLTGIKGTKMLQIALGKIARGEGEESDLALLERVGAILDEAAKCSVCQSSGELVKDGLRYFRRQFIDAISSGLPEQNLSYMAKISAPCMTTCPCHIEIPTYIELLQETRYAQALSTIREEMPLAGVTGRVCPAPCERACTLANMGKPPIPIKVLKRVPADYEMLHNLPAPLEKLPLTAPPVAVVGAGPAGLAAAYYLNRLGHPVTMFEALPAPGGMVGVGIPPYRQPREVLTREISVIRDLGVDLRNGVALGRDVTIQALFEQGFKAVFLGIGSHKSVPLGIKGENEGIQGVFSGGIDFLRALNLGLNVTVGDKVIIVGGGNTAIDCARTCLRLGSTEVHVVYRRTEKQMPSDPREVEDAMEEGAIFHFLTQPVEILWTDGRMKGLRCIKMELGEPDASGRRRPVPVEDSEFDMEADTLIPAIGQKADLSFLSPEDEIEITRQGTIKVDKHTMMTSRSGVFAGGDAVSGPLTVVHGVAGGKLAARMMHSYLTTGRCAPLPDQEMDEILQAVEKQTHILVTPRPETRLGGRDLQKKLDMRERLSTFEEVESGLSQHSSYIESSRCLRCFHLVLAAVKREDYGAAGSRQ
ncbi:MAG: dihydropyrimidine dehydrogenase subunit A [Deltaproteobacteria bacterium]|nr:dihydropyrimidine dehydrogenase subunit A [Deltaproteobacteria bacterium]